MAAKRKPKRKGSARAGVYGSFEAVKRTLRETVRPRHPVRVRVCELEPDLAGDCDLIEGKRGDRRFVIRINEAVDETAKVLMLLHEWAHAISWHAPGPDHGKAWGRAFARCYRVIGAP